MLTDIRFALRLLVKDRSFTITAVLTLAICIAANTAMFGIVRSVLLKPLPFADSDRVLLLYNSYPGAGAPRVGAAVPDYFDRQAAVPALDQSALFRREGMTFGDANGAERLGSLRATPSFFRMMGVRAQQGRLFDEQEAEPGKNRKALLSHGFWLRKFGGQSSAIGQTVRLNNQAYEVVGVLPRTFSFLQDDTDVYVPAAFGPDDKSDNQRHSNNWQMVGRLKPGATIDQVRQQVDAVNANNDIRFPQFRQILKDARFKTVVVGLQDDLVRDVKKSLYLLWGGVLFVLLIGGVNIANLVIVRSSGRTREMATRHAIGGDLARLMRQILTETTLLALVGGAAGVLVGWWLLRSVALLNLDQLPRGYEIGLDGVSIAAILGLTLLVGVLLGLAPALRLPRMNLNVELREETRGGTAGRRANLARAALATVQIALALFLLVGAGLLLASFRAVLRLDLGFEPANVMTAAVNLPGADNPAVISFAQRTLQTIRALPDVQAAGVTTLIPFSGDINYNVILAEGHVMRPGESLTAPSTVTVSPGYFEAIGARLVAGRAFDERDTASSPKVAVIDDRLARQFWNGQDAVGRRLYRPSDPKDVTKITKDTEFYNVVGVIKEMQLMDPRGDYTPVGVAYFPLDQNPSRGMSFAIKTRGGSASIVSSLRQAVTAVNPQVPVFRPRTMPEWIDRTLAGRRLPMIISLAFGLVALLLAAIGVYGVLAYNVSQRRRDLGVRMALGGTASDVFRLVLFYGLRIVVVGLAIGLALSLFLGQIMKTLLFNVGGIDPGVLAIVSAGLLTVALVASVIPAWRASRIDPSMVLSR